MLPPIATLEMLRGALPVFVRVTSWAALVVPTFWLLKVRLDVDKLAVGVPPTPDRLTVCGLPAALLRMVRLPVSVPAAVGVKVTLMAHAAPGATLGPQLSVSPKLVSTVIPRRRFCVPVLVTVTVWAGLVVPVP